MLSSGIMLASLLRRTVSLNVKQITNIVLCKCVLHTYPSKLIVYNFEAQKLPWRFLLQGGSTIGLL
jgi:hypothetical protein